MKSFKIVPPIPFKASELKKLPKHKYRSFKVLIAKGSKQLMKLEGYMCCGVLMRASGEST